MRSSSGEPRSTGMTSPLRRSDLDVGVSGWRRGDATAGGKLGLSTRSSTGGSVGGWLDGSACSAGVLLPSFVRSGTEGNLSRKVFARLWFASITDWRDALQETDRLGRSATLEVEDVPASETSSCDVRAGIETRWVTQAGPLVRSSISDEVAGRLSCKASERLRFASIVAGHFAGHPTD